MASSRPKMYIPTIKATDTNIFVLKDHLSRTDEARAARVDMPHLKRCILAGLVNVVDGKLVLTDSGHKAIKNYNLEASSASETPPEKKPTIQDYGFESLEKVFFVENSNPHRRFYVRLVQKGDRYGLNLCLEHKDEEPMVEIYDAKHMTDGKFQPMGQFVSRYNVSDFAAIEAFRGLCLQGDIPEWYIDPSGVIQIKCWLLKELLKQEFPGSFK
jgi:hypothetical protein